VKRACRGIVDNVGPFRRRSERLFLPVVVTTGIIAIVASLYQLAIAPVDERWYVLAALTVLSGSATLRIPGTSVSFSISDSFTMAAALLFGPAAGTVTVAIDSLVITMRLARNPIPIKRVFYNATAPPLAMWTAAQVLLWFAGADGVAGASLPRLIGPLALFAATFFLLNTGLIAIAIAFEQRLSAVHIWREHFLSLWLTYFGGATVAAQLIVLMQQRHADLSILLLLAPIPLIIYATFRHAVGRMEDRVGHLDQVNGMYLSTIETLAQAIDAKDQVTHGHIRRVQKFAMKLAHALGITDPAQLRALEAASLLHDVGKLAVPEHILNKPSTLTPTEFETMKRHADIGADILSSIRFPYPVVPIVRHHHESWDGSGYPAGLAGEAIPIGARILSVVDCFDAVTSDRPYRQRLSQHEAIRVLQARSGTVYDPRVVKAFLEVFESVPTEPEATIPSEALSNITRTAQDEKLRSGGSSYSSETLAMLFDLGFHAARASTPADALSRIHPVLHRMMPADVIAVYLYSAQADNLVATYVSGGHADAIAGTTIQLGQRLTGWVAANKQTIVNSDAALDLGNLTMHLDPMPLACLSTPMCQDADLVGVVTIYSTRRQPFTDAHVPVVEVIARGLANLIPPSTVATPPKPLAVRMTDTPSGIRVH
jgi:putative nucleotidyltransferase with HDIG domain